MQVQWMIQTSFTKNKNDEDLALAVLNDGGKVIGANIRPFDDELNPLSEFDDNFPHTVPYGSTKLREIVKDRLWHAMFSAYDSPYSECVKHRSDMLNADLCTGALRDIQVNPSSTHFMKPDHDGKAFNGGVMTSEEIFRVQNELHIGHHEFAPVTPVLVSTVKQILEEHRWFIVDSKVIDGSRYRKNNMVSCEHADNGLLAQAQTLADVWLPHHTCVMDTAITPFGIKIVEFNWLNCSGFYGHDIPKIVKSINQYVRSK